ncbi:MAG: hypothetical protein HFF93_04445 [Oscillibacter sp.]|nr:hypothetical protein [Oscillibacter sp.]
MKASYREMFDEVRASKRLNEEVLNMTKQERTQVVKKVSISFIIAAALAVLLAGTALAAAIGIPQTLQEWFGRQWTEAGGGEEMPKEQAEVIKSLVQPVGVTAITNGVSVTLDSVTPGEGSVCLMLKVKGERLSGKWDFMRTKITGGPMEKMAEGPIGFSSHWKDLGTTEDGTQVFLYWFDAPKGVNFLEGGEMELRLQDIELRDENPVPPGTYPEGIMVSADLEGTWILPFALEPLTDQPALTAKSACVPCTKWEWGENFSNETTTEITIDIQDIRVTSIGYSYLLPKELVEFCENCDYDRKLPVLNLKGGMAIEGLDSGHGQRGAVTVSHLPLITHYQINLQQAFGNKGHNCRQSYPKRRVKPDGHPRCRHDAPLQDVPGQGLGPAANRHVPLVVDFDLLSPGLGRVLCVQAQHQKPRQPDGRHAAAGAHQHAAQAVGNCLPQYQRRRGKTQPYDGKRDIQRLFPFHDGSSS